MKSWPKVKLGHVGVSSNIAQNLAHSKLYMFIICPHFTWKVDKKGKVIICPYLSLSTLIGPTIYHFNPYLALFSLIFSRRYAASASAASADI